MPHFTSSDKYDSKQHIPPLGTPVTTPRNDVQMIITKHGNADLREFSVAERVDVLIAIAPPDFRESLKEEAIAAGLCK